MLLDELGCEGEELLGEGWLGLLAEGEGVLGVAGAEVLCSCLQPAKTIAEIVIANSVACLPIRKILLKCVVSVVA